MYYLGINLQTPMTRENAKKSLAKKRSRKKYNPNTPQKTSLREIHL
jgi:hypothetical protein